MPNVVPVPKREGADVVVPVPNIPVLGVHPKMLGVCVVPVPNKLEVVAGVENRFEVEGVPKMLGLDAGAPNKLGAVVVVAPKVPPKLGAEVVVEPKVLPNAGAEVAAVPKVLPNAGAVLGPGVPKVLPNTGAELAAGVPKVPPNDGAVDATGIPNDVDPNPKPLDVVVVAPNGELKPAGFVPKLGCPKENDIPADTHVHLLYFLFIKKK